MFIWQSLYLNKPLYFKWCNLHSDLISTHSPLERASIAKIFKIRVTTLFTSKYQWKLFPFLCCISNCSVDVTKYLTNATQGIFYFGSQLEGRIVMVAQLEGRIVMVPQLEGRKVMVAHSWRVEMS